MRIISFICTLLAFGSLIGPAVAGPKRLEIGGKLLLTRGISSVDGAAGGGLTPWALIAGNETDRGIGATAHATTLSLPDFDLRTYGVAIGVKNRIEFSYAKQEFDTGDTGPALGLTPGFTFAQHIAGMKFRIAGDAVYDQDKVLPQISIGAFVKEADHGTLLEALGAEDNGGVEGYLSATKLVLSRSLLLNGTVRYTDANQNGLLGFGGENGESFYAEGSIGWMLSRRLIVGAEFRQKPNHLAFAKEDDWWDLYAAYALSRHVTATAAYGDLGSIATFDGQRGFLFQVQGGF